MGVVRLMLICCILLPGGTSGEWSMKALPRRAISSSCVVIPCIFDIPSHSYTALNAAWYKYWYYWKYTVAYTKDPNYAMTTFVGRAKIIGDLDGKNCSLRINNVSPADSDVYYFYVDAEGYGDHVFKDPVQLQVLDVPDKPDILLPKDFQEGTLAHIICKCLSTCPDNQPNLTWSELLTSSVNTITENGGEISAVLTFNASFKHHRLTIHCMCDYPQTKHQVESSVTLSVKYSPRNTSVRMILEKGERIYLSCSSDGNPAVHNFTWFKISQKEVTNEKLAGQTIVVPNGLKEEISYYCEATNLMGSSQSLPIRIPTEYGAVILPESRCTQYLTNLTCLCLVRAHASINITWSMPGRTLGQKGSDGIYETEWARAGSLVTSTLIIKGSNMTVQMVNCSVVNSQGGRRIQRRLEIQAVGGQGGTRWGLMWKIGLVAAGGAVLIVLTTVICLIIKALRKNKKPVQNGTNQNRKANPEEQSEIMSMKPKAKKSKYVEIIPTRPKMSQNKDVKNLEMKYNHGVSPEPNDLYANCDFVDGAL
ncbi:myelin-associated glycoprotein-like isoform X1 [Scyliorhinus canicula]|uniref:myelin-associated glycoprotein-like isoform X1 n=1 Tax=Scyliorhinus canicula TaxID=7830 RepID=UPI0018F6BB87|nr:myelin-associated glycoprotein-like isoform X1 [Scyliorhinus canicula]XP_038670878.1 myelin-associated glycoprotein-like isoform X1 [Scyliorhinus canicula]